MAATELKEYAREPLQALRSVKVLSALREPALERLNKYIRWIELKPGQRLSMHRADTAAESYYFVQEGQMAVILADQQRAAEDPPSAKMLSQLKKEWQFLSFFGPGDFFSDGYSAPEQRTAGINLDCVATVESVLASLPRETLAKAMGKMPKWAALLKKYNLRLRRKYRSNKSSSRRMVQDFFLRHGYSFAETLKVIQLDRCLACDGCESACSARHGVSRLSRVGPTLGGLAFPISCRSCQDHRCVAACGFDAIATLESGEVRIDNAKCVGCAGCHMACPNDVINMVEVAYEAKDFPKPLPDTNGHGMTNVDGLYLIGESAGSALIKLAINSGVTAVEHYIANNETGASSNGVDDIIIAGAGPAGLSAALKCREAGVRFRIFDKGDFATTIQNYPRHKMVMAEPAHIPLYGSLWLRDTTKEDLIAKWEEVIRETDLKIQSDEPVTGVVRNDDGGFIVRTPEGEYQARAVILAVGNRGSPRKIGVDGETHGRVKYVLTDPDELKGKRILVVGGGDSAVEAAMTLADTPETTVALSYRRDAFGRNKARNKVRIAEYGAAGKVELIMSSTVTKITDKQVVLKIGDEEKRLKNDVIIAMLGAEPPTKFFEDAGIRIVQPKTPAMDALAKTRGMRRYASKCDHCVDFSDQACLSACPTDAIVEIKPSDLFVVATGSSGGESFNEDAFTLGLDQILGRKRRRWWHLATAITATLIAGATGVEVFLRTKAPEFSLLDLWNHATGSLEDVTYASGRGLGLTLGIVGSVFMALAALYPFQSRLRLFNPIAKTRVWMTLHIWAGILGPLFITYHTLLKLNRWPSIAFWAAWAVVLTGLSGRYIQTSFKHTIGLAELEMETLSQERQRLFDQWWGVRGRTRIFNAVEAQSALTRLPVFLMPLLLLWQQGTSLSRLLWLKYFGLRQIKDSILRERTLQNFSESARVARRRLLADTVTRSVSFWQWLHLILTVVLFSVAILHIVFALLYKAD